MSPADQRASLKVSDVARELAVTVATVRRWCNLGELKCARTPGGQRRFSAAEVDRVRREMWERGR